MTSKRIEAVDLDAIVVDGNIRSIVDERTIEELGQSMRSVGQQMPAKGRLVDGKCILIDGMRRYLAAKSLGWTSLDVIIERAELTEVEVLQRQVIINSQRSDVSVLDKARAIDDLMKRSGWNASETASRLGFSNGTLTRLMALLSLPEEVRQQIKSGKLAASTAYELSRVEDTGKRDELFRAAATGKLTRDMVVTRVRQEKSTQRTKRGPSSRAVAALSGERSVTVTARELTLDSFIATVEELLAKARRSRSRNVELGTFLRLLRDEAKAAEVNHAS